MVVTLLMLQSFKNLYVHGISQDQYCYVTMQQVNISMDKLFVYKKKKNATYLLFFPLSI